MNIPLLLRYLAHNVFNIGRDYSYTPPPGGFILHDEAEYDAITWTDGETKPAWFYLTDNVASATQWAFEQDVWNNWDGVKAQAAKSTRTSSAYTASLVTSDVAGGSQVHATKDASVRAGVSCSTTVNISTGAAATSGVIAEICPTNSNTPGDWVEAGRFEANQTVSLAIALGMVQTNKGQICFDVPAGYHHRLRKFGTGTHTEAFVSGQKTIYG